MVKSEFSHISNLWMKPKQIEIFRKHYKEINDMYDIDDETISTLRCIFKNKKDCGN